MGSPTWLYHKDHPNGVIFDDEALPPEEEGWVDSPALLPKEDKPKPRGRPKKKAE